MPDEVHALVLDGQILEWRNYAPNVNQNLLSSNKPKMLPRVIENESYNPVTQVREGPTYLVESKRVVERYTVRDKSPEEIEAMRTEKVAAVKSEAAARILGIMPDHKQRNNLALAIEMITTHGTDPTKWPIEMQAIHTAAMDDWAKIKALRVISNAKEAEIAALEDPVAVDDYKPTRNWK